MIIAVDFDGTIVEHRYPAIGREKPGAIDTLLRLQEEGNKIILFTVRDGELLDDAVEYCRKRGLEFFAVNSNIPKAEILNGFKPLGGKVLADVYLDDRNLGGLPEWDEIYDRINEQRSKGKKPRKKKSFWSKLFGK